MNYQNILDRFKEVNVPELSGIKKEIKELSNILQENEIIMYGTRGSYDGGVWLITCTDKRILFLDKGMIKLKQVEIPIDKINSVSFKKGMVFGKIVIHHGSASMEIGNINKETLNPLVEAINHEIEAHKSGVKQPVRKSDDTADEIVKFKKLFDEGVITEEEFQAKKKQLLGL